MEGKKFYTVEEAAEELGFSVGTVRNRIEDHSLFAFQSKKRGAWRIPAASLDDYKASLGLGPGFEPTLLPPKETRTVSADEYFASRIAPRLAAAGVEDVPALLRLLEARPDLYGEFSDVLDTYSTYLRELANAKAPAEGDLAYV